MNYKLISSYHANAVFIFSFSFLIILGGVFGSPAFALPQKPLFEIEFGNNSPEKLGKKPKEDEIKEYDKYYCPAAFCVFENMDLILVLDSINNRVCRYNVKGEFLGEFKLSSSGHPIDFAWVPSTGTAFFIFQDTSEMNVLNVDFKTGKNSGALKTFNILEAAGKKDCKDFDVRKIWPANVSDTAENCFVLNINSDFGANLAFSYKNGALFKMKDIGEAFVLPAAMPQKTFLFGVCSDETGAKILLQNIYTGETSSVSVSADLTMQKGFGAKKIRPAGSDLNNNLYLEAGFGETEDAITQNFIYKFDANGRFLGRSEIFISPGMLSNRFIAIDSGGGIFYMKKDAENDKFQFYKFEIVETK